MPVINHQYITEEAIELTKKILFGDDILQELILLYHQIESLSIGNRKFSPSQKTRYFALSSDDRNKIQIYNFEYLRIILGQYYYPIPILIISILSIFNRLF